MDAVDPNRCNPNMLIVLPSRAKLLTDIEDPRFTQSIMEGLVRKIALDSNFKFEPKRAKERTDKLDPRLTKSITLKLEPSRVIP
jgi:hypothetical protein